MAGAGIYTFSQFILCGGNKDAYFGIDPTQGSVDAYKELNMHGYNIVNAGDVSSDGRLKKSIYTSGIEAIERIKQIKHRQFVWKKDGKKEDIGYIAQELENIDKNYVRHNLRKNSEGNVEEDSYEIRILPILATATKAIQEQQALIEKQQKQINVLMQKLNLPLGDEPIQENPIEEPETIYPGQATIEDKKILEKATKYITKIKTSENGEVEIHTEKEVS